MKNLTCYAEQNPTQGHPTLPLCLLQKFVHVMRRECLKHLRIPVKDVVQSDGAYAKQPYYHDGCKQKPYTVCPIVL